MVYCEHEEKGKLKISKGLVDKVLVTGDDGGDCWECADAASRLLETEETPQLMTIPQRSASFEIGQNQIAYGSPNGDINDVGETVS